MVKDKFRIRKVWRKPILLDQLGRRSLWHVRVERRLVRHKLVPNVPRPIRRWPRGRGPGILDSLWPKIKRRKGNRTTSHLDHHICKTRKKGCLRKKRSDKGCFFSACKKVQKGIMGFAICAVVWAKKANGNKAANLDLIRRTITSHVLTLRQVKLSKSSLLKTKCFSYVAKWPWLFKGLNLEFHKVCRSLRHNDNQISSFILRQFHLQSCVASSYLLYFKTSHRCISLYRIQQSAVIQGKAARLKLGSSIYLEMWTSQTWILHWRLMFFIKYSSLKGEPIIKAAKYTLTFL